VFIIFLRAIAAVHRLQANRDVSLPANQQLFLKEMDRLSNAVFCILSNIKNFVAIIKGKFVKLSAIHLLFSQNVI